MVANIFGASPVQPLERHIDLCHEAAAQLGPFFAAVLASDWTTAEEVRKGIDRLEHQADDLKKEIRLHLPKSLFMPVPRQDLLELLLVQDRIANQTRRIASTVMVRRLTVPESLAEPMRELVARVIDASAQARRSVRELDEMFSSGFRGAEADLVASMIDEIDRLETDTDRMQYELFAALYDLEATLNPVEAVFLYRVVEMLGGIADMAERVGRRLELLLAR